jgi:Fe-S-cluster containining protein
MISQYEDFLKEFDVLLDNLFENQKRYIKCRKGCSKCCEIGDYPFSQLEFSYLTKGFLSLPTEKKKLVQENIKRISDERKSFKGDRFQYSCPFLIDNECCIYAYRGLVCRTFGLCYYDETIKAVKLPECVNFGLNYSEFFDKKSHTLNIQNVPQINLRIDKIFESDMAKKYGLDCGGIRALDKWIIK